jgi:anti-sigma B factor antagonist
MAGNPLQLSVRHGDGAIDVVVSGDLDMAGVFKLEPVLDELGPELVDTEVVIDLRPTTFIDSSGIGLLVSANERLNERGARVRLLPGTSEVMRPFEVSGLDSALPFEQR